MRRERIMHITVLGIDLGKNSCSLVGLDEAGRVVLRRRMRRDGVVRFVERLSPCTVAMEACCGAHHLGRELAGFGHAVRLMSPEYVRPYVKAHKNDDRDAEAIAEAATRPTMRFVELKSEEQLDLQTLHRSRSRLVSERTALINQLRAILLERGILLRKAAASWSSVLVISPRMRILIEDSRLAGSSAKPQRQQPTVKALRKPLRSPPLSSQDQSRREQVRTCS